MPVKVNAITAATIVSTAPKAIGLRSPHTTVIGRSIPKGAGVATNLYAMTAPHPGGLGDRSD
jgi:hypothetical protein